MIMLSAVQIEREIESLRFVCVFSVLDLGYVCVSVDGYGSYTHLCRYGPM
ncbi:hypothetical protein HanIR_Chr08g0375491 [Helianthus annuus]|nr:hypothetical protein HanIR_Chr14g0678011 [Helianthus annuus]KAJ0466966.1 hypothetical protein HanIR_Chr14g0678021 [Helianthus annuus]KAJ0547732.1 hypothetical protein HanIR_Chr08g0375491 [Helianthus annuus]